jgi:TRAP-type C4-dicarboxylate transport system permease small subunit
MEKIIMAYEKNILKWGVHVINIPIYAMTVIEVLNAIGRKLFIPVPCAIEATESFLVIAVYFGVSLVAMEKGHVNVTLATGRLSPPKQNALDALAHAFGVMVFGFLASGAWAEFIKALRIMEVRLGVFPFPLWPFRMFFALGLTMLTIQLAINVLKLTYAALGRPSYASLDRTEQSEVEAGL